MSCKGCKKDLKIVNKFHGLCLICNNKRLEAKKKPKSNKHTTKKRKSLKTNETRLKRTIRGGGRRIGKTYEQDEWFYEQCFNNSDHKCEECGRELPKKFRDEEGNVIARFRYSHIVPKSIAPHLRHDLNNINHLCHEHHFQWDMGDKKLMKIYEENKKKFPEYFR